MRRLTLITTLLLLLLPLTISAQGRLESPNYVILDSAVDSAGGVSTGANYNIINSLNPLNDARLTSGSYALGSGFPNGIQANVPTVRCFETNTDDTAGGPTNTSCTDPALTNAVGGTDTIAGNGMIGVCGSPGCYNRAKLEINPVQNPIDTLYLVAVSADNFTNPANTYYLKSDKTLSSSVSMANYLTLCELQGYDGRSSNCDQSSDPGWDRGQQESNIAGLACGTTYYIKARAYSGDFSETQYSPVVSATTECPTISFDVDISATNSESSSPYSINLGSLTNTVTTANHYIWLDLSSNAAGGSSAYLQDSNNGLYSASTSQVITSETEDLAVSDGDGGYGLQEISSNVTSGGPVIIDPAFDLSGENVAQVTTTPALLFYTTNYSSTHVGPVAGGRVQLAVKARGDTGIRAGSYRDILTFTVSASW